MSQVQFDDETLMAYADGELDAAQALSVEAALRDDQELAARVAGFRRSAVLARQAYEADLHEPVPAGLQASVLAAIARHGEAPQSVAVGAGAAEDSAVPRQGATTAAMLPPTPSTDRRRRALRAANQPVFALAASVAAFAFGALGYLLGAQQRGDDGTVLVAGVQVTATPAERAALNAALNKLPSGQQRALGAAGPGASVELVASFRDRSGHLCREFTLQRGTTENLLGLACRSESEWRVAFAAATPLGGNGFAPAGSAAALDAYLASIEAGTTLNAEDEAAALARDGS